MADKIVPVKEHVAQRAHVSSFEDYQRLYQESVADPAAFWSREAQRIDWFRAPDRACDVDFGKAEVAWFLGGKTNAAHNCVDRHLPEKRDDVAIIWEGDEPDRDLTITYGELHERVCRFANSLKALGASKGDRITIYMPMIPEAAVAMLACVRIGAIHSVVFGGFSPDALAGRIQDCDSTMVITADEGVRGGRPIPLKANTDEALKSCPDCRTVFVVKRTGGTINWVDGRDVWYHAFDLQSLRPLQDPGLGSGCQTSGAFGDPCERGAFEGRGLGEMLRWFRRSPQRVRAGECAAEPLPSIYWGRFPLTNAHDRERAQCHRSKPPRGRGAKTIARRLPAVPQAAICPRAGAGRGRAAVYAALYFLPSLSLVHAVAGGLVDIEVLAVEGPLGDLKKALEGDDTDAIARFEGHGVRLG